MIPRQWLVSGHRKHASVEAHFGKLRQTDATECYCESWPPTYCIVARDTLADVLGQVNLRTKSCPVEKLFY